LGGDLLEGRTVLLVTHNVVLAEQISDFVVVLGLDGRMTSQGSMTDALKSNSRLRRKQTQEMTKAEIEENTTGGKKEGGKSGKLIVKEEMGVGHVSWEAGSSSQVFA
jgi:ABC-type multidrug transport system ATPase subunit